MDLIDLMTVGADPVKAALDRLRSILDRYESDDSSQQDEAFERARAYCLQEWGGYGEGLEALAQRTEAEGGESLDAAMAALRYREEAEEPGRLIRAARRRLEERTKNGGARAAVLARYGSEQAALAPTPVERLFIEAARVLADDPDDPFSPLAGWSLPWHPLPDPLRTVVSQVIALPERVTDAHDECLSWEERRRERAVFGDGPGEALLPLACAARLRIVEDLWRKDLPARTPEDLRARLTYWSEQGGDDGTGYGVLRADLERVLAAGALARPATTGNTRDAAHRLKQAHPDWSLARIGKELAISRQAVHKHLKRGV